MPNNWVFICLYSLQGCGDNSQATGYSLLADCECSHHIRTDSPSQPFSVSSHTTASTPPCHLVARCATKCTSDCTFPPRLHLFLVFSFSADVVGAPVGHAGGKSDGWFMQLFYRAVRLGGKETVEPRGDDNSGGDFAGAPRTPREAADDDG